MKILSVLLTILVVVLVLGYTIPAIWPLIGTNATAQIAAMTGTDTGTTMIKTLFPVAILLIGIGLGVAIIMYAVKKFRTET